MATTDLLTLQLQAERIADAVVPGIGRPPVIVQDPERVQMLLASLADGNYREVACRIAGFPVNTFYQTMKRAEAGEPGAIAFRDAVEKTEALAEGETVRHIRNAGKLPQFWAAGMTFLERKSPDRWGRRQDDASVPRVVVQIGSGATDVQVTVSTSAHLQCADSAELLSDPIRSDPSVHAGVVVGDGK